MQFCVARRKVSLARRGQLKMLRLLCRMEIVMQREGDGKVFLRAAAAAVCKYKFYLFPFN